MKIDERRHQVRVGLEEEAAYLRKRKCFSDI